MGGGEGRSQGAHLHPPFFEVGIIDRSRRIEKETAFETFEDIVSYFIKAFRGNENGGPETRAPRVRDELLVFRSYRAQFPSLLYGWVLENDNVTRPKFNFSCCLHCWEEDRG